MKDMDKILDYLKQLELSDEEASIYLTLLQTGPVSVKSLAEEVDIKRTTAYIYINTLINKGLIAKVVQGAQKMVAANDPTDCLEYLVKKKLEKAETIKKDFPSMLKTITTSLPPINNISDAEIRYYKGKNGVMKIYEEALQAKELRSYVDVSDIDNIFPENYKLFDNALKKNQKIQMFEIAENSPSSQKLTEMTTKSERYHFKLLPDNMKLTSQDILIYDGCVGIINLKENVYGVILRNTDLFENMKQLFDFTWKVIP